MALLVAVVNVSRENERGLDKHLSRVARSTGLTSAQVKNIRTRFMRNGGAEEKYRALAFSLSKLSDGYDQEQYFEVLINKYNNLKTK